MKRKTKFITLEGVDGAGKSTHINFIKKYLADNKINFLFTREPGGTVLGERLREILLEISPSQSTNERTLSHSRGGNGCHVVIFAA